VEEIELLAKLAYYVLKASDDDGGPARPSTLGTLLAVGGIALGIGLLVVGVGLAFADVWAIIALIVAAAGIAFLVFGMLVLYVMNSHRGDLEREASSTRYTVGPASAYHSTAPQAAAYHQGGAGYAARPADGIDRIGGAVGDLVSTTIHTLVPGRLTQPAPASPQPTYQGHATYTPYAVAQQQPTASPPSVSILDRGDHYEVRAWAGTDDWSDVRWHTEAALVVVETKKATGDPTPHGVGAPQGPVVRRETWSRLAVSMPGPFDATSPKVDLAGGWLTICLPRA